MVDISPELLAQISESFKDNAENREIQTLLKAIKDGTATYIDANAYAYEMGEALAQAFGDNLSSTILPDGKLHYNIAEKTVRPMLEENYKKVSEATAQVQNALNKNAGIGLKAQTAPINTDRIDGIINKLSSADNYDDVAWMLDEPVKNFSQSIVDETLRKNVDFQGKAGLSPKIIRIAETKCCKWCQNLEGEYSYPNVPDDIYRRHERCRCIVDYDSVSLKRQSGQTKKWTAANESDIIEARKQLGKKTFDTSKYKHNSDGTLWVSQTTNHSLPKNVEANEIIDVITQRGNVSRTIYNENAQRAMRIDTTDHGFPKQHPMGSHKHNIKYNKEGRYVDDGKPTILTPKDREENADIL